MPKTGTWQVFKCFRGFDAKNIKIPSVKCKKYTESFCFCKCNKSLLKYNCLMITVDWLAAGALLIIHSSIRLVNDQICWRRIGKFLQSMGSKGLLPWLIRSNIILIKYILPDNLVMQSCVRFYPKKNVKNKLSVLGYWTSYSLTHSPQCTWNW